jgi:hypothetical protein
MNSRAFIMFASLHPSFKLKQLVPFVVALWLQVAVLVVLCGISSPQMSRPVDSVDTVHALAVDGT